MIGRRRPAYNRLDEIWGVPTCGEGVAGDGDDRSKRPGGLLGRFHDDG